MVSPPSKALADELNYIHNKGSQIHFPNIHEGSNMQSHQNSNTSLHYNSNVQGSSGLLGNGGGHNLSNDNLGML